MIGSRNPSFENGPCHGSAVGAPETDERPAVVAAGRQDVHLVSAVRPVLDLPDRAGERVLRHPQERAVAHREDFGPGVGAADERIVGWHLALVREPQDLAAERLGRLRIAASVRDVQHAVAAERDRAAAAAFAHEDVLRAGEPFAVPDRTRDGHRRPRRSATTTSSCRGGGWRRGAGRRVERLGVADIDGAVAFEVRVQRQVRAGQPRPDGHRRAGHGLRIDHAVSHDLDGAAAFGHEDRVVRHERHAPRDYGSRARRRSRGCSVPPRSRSGPARRAAEES